MNEGRLKAGTAGVTRRQVLAGVGAVSAAAATLPGNALAAPAMLRTARQSGDDAPSVEANSGTGLVQTTHGPIAGFRRNGIFTYKGLPYAADTGGSARFRAPKPPVAWAEPRSSRAWGPVCPQPSRGDGRHNDEETFLFDWDDSTARVYAAGSGEDCLRLNVWTPALRDGNPRPVLFWIHGGGFTNGSGHEQPSYDGENLARTGDVVVVSINHRLGVFGYLDLSSYGAEYAESGNVGMLDLVAALEWVRDNIAAFGGNPECVTIFGQSGGGSKVCALMGMKAAHGLFHRAIAESGSLEHAVPQERARRLADQLVAELALTHETISRIHDVPAETLMRAAGAVLARQASAPAAERLGFGPVADGIHLLADSNPPVASPLSAGIPFLAGSTLNEFTTAMNHPELARMTEAELAAKVRATHGDSADEVLAAFDKGMPKATPFQRWSVIASVPVRMGAIRQCTAKASASKAPVYLYWFVWQSPMFEGRPGAFHCSEIAFVFRNTDRCDTMTGGGARPRALAETVGGAWLQFARTGNPNGPGLPHWQPFDAATVPTMIFDDTSRCENNPDGPERDAAMRHTEQHRV